MEKIMVATFKFGRLDSHTKYENYVYTTKTGNDANWTSQALMMEEVGAHWSISIKNYMREDLVMISNLRVPPRRFPSIYSYERFMLEDTTNFVIIDIRYRENEFDKNSQSKIKTLRKIEIRCPGYYLEKNSLFLEELGCYFTISSRLDATKTQIVQDAKLPPAKEASVTSSMMTPNPSLVFGDMAPFVKMCIERTDKIQVRVGVKVEGDPNRVPEHVKDLRLSILDRDFSPYHNNRMIFDPTLDEDTFIIENIHSTHNQPLELTFSQLANSANGIIYIETDEYNTINGMRCGLVILKDDEALANYIFSNDAEKLYSELSKRIVEETGGYALNKKIESLQSDNANLNQTIAELGESLKLEKNQSKEYKRIAQVHEETIRRLTENQEASLSYDAVMAEINHEREKLQLERDKLENDKLELISKKETAAISHQATRRKATAETAKAYWGILIIIAGGIPVIYGWWKKLNSFAVS